MADPIVLLDHEALVELRLAVPPRNILDGATLDELTRAIRRVAQHRHARAILLTAEGPTFSVGAAVAEHAHAQVTHMLSRFGAMIGTLLHADLPIVAAVRGHCLGGGLELALCATRIHVGADAQLGQPEIRLGALAPVASLLLPRRIGQGRAEELLLTGRILGAREALAIGLVDAIDDDPEAAARAWIHEHLAPLSASSLRAATHAARLALTTELDHLLPELTRYYLERLAPTHDAEEGIHAFVEKRSPRWEHS